MKKILKETEPIPNEREWDKQMRIPERASLVEDEPRWAKKPKGNQTMTRMKEVQDMGRVGVFKQLTNTGYAMNLCKQRFGCS